MKEATKPQFYYAGKVKLGLPKVGDHVMTVRIKLHDQFPFELLERGPSNLPAGSSWSSKKQSRAVHLWKLNGVGFNIDQADNATIALMEGGEPGFHTRLCLGTLEREHVRGTKDGDVVLIDLSCELRSPLHPLLSLALDGAEFIAGLYTAQGTLDVDTPAEADPEPEPAPEPGPDDGDLAGLQAADQDVPTAADELIDAVADQPEAEAVDPSTLDDQPFADLEPAPEAEATDAAGEFVAAVSADDPPLVEDAPAEPKKKVLRRRKKDEVEVVAPDQAEAAPSSTLHDWLVGYLRDNPPRIGLSALAQAAREANPALLIYPSQALREVRAIIDAEPGVYLINPNGTVVLREALAAESVY